MSSPIPDSAPGFHTARMIHEDLKDLRESWLWFVVLGVALIVAGIAAFTYSVVASMVAAVVFGCFLVVGGVFYLTGAFFTRGWGGFFLSLLAGVLNLAAGFIIINHPAEATILYTLLLSVFFFAEGLFRIVGALAGRFRHWEWTLISGIVTLLLGIMIWQQWPVSGLYVVGLFLGINLIVHGATYVNLGLAARKIPV